MDNFETWLEQKFLQWQSARGKRGSIREFSEWLRSDQKLVAHWMRGVRKPGPENARVLALKLGLEVYDVLGLPRPDPDFFRIQTVWDALPERERMVVTLYYHEELTLREIGEILDLSEGRICQIFAQAVGRLRDALGVSVKPRAPSAGKRAADARKAPSATKAVRV